ncbi:MAG: 50S ribosomal protein L6 [Magnetococcus sp. XQGC-1]
MSRIGKKAISVPQGVEVTIDNQAVTVKGKLGTLTRHFHSGVRIDREGGSMASR